MFVQAVLHGSLSNGDGSSNNVLHTGETRLAYIPTVASGNDAIQTGLDISSNTMNINTTAGSMLFASNVIDLNMFTILQTIAVVTVG